MLNALMVSWFVEMITIALIAILMNNVLPHEFVAGACVDSAHQMLSVPGLHRIVARLASVFSAHRVHNAVQAKAAATEFASM
jgi:hypothetical protein